MNSALDDRAPSPLPPVQPLGHEISRPSSTSTQASAILRHSQNGAVGGVGAGTGTGSSGALVGGGGATIAAGAAAIGGGGSTAEGGPAVSLPGLSTLANVATVPSPQLRSFNGSGSSSSSQHFAAYSAASPTPTSVGGQGNNPPICQNCQTSTTPLWRRDEIGSVLCNACGLFLKLHGRPRPISLKTDVIKSRNRVKSSTAQHKKKPLFNGNGTPVSHQDAGTPPPLPPLPPHHGLRHHKSYAAMSERSASPISRTTTPGLLHGGHLHGAHPHDIPPLPPFDPSPAGGPVATLEPSLRHSPSLPSFHFRHPSPVGSTTSIGDSKGGAGSASGVAPAPAAHLEPPQSYEGLQQTNSALRTRVTELEVINGIIKEQLYDLTRRNEDLRAQLEQQRHHHPHHPAHHDSPTTSIKDFIPSSAGTVSSDWKRRMNSIDMGSGSPEIQTPHYKTPTSAVAKRRIDVEADLSNPEDSPPLAKKKRESDVSVGEEHVTTS